jgi:hypothetical protein
VQIPCAFGTLLALQLSLLTPGVLAQAQPETVSLTVSAGRPLEIVVDRRISVKRVGQAITGTVVEPIYAYDRVVVPAGTRVSGHIAALEAQSRLARTRALLRGDFTPARRVVLQFDTLLLPEGPVPMRTVVDTEIPHLTRNGSTAAGSDEKPTAGSAAGRVDEAVKSKAKEAVATAKQARRDVLAEITAPGKTERLEHELVQRLPYHPQFIDAGTGYQAELLDPLDFGRASPAQPAGAGTEPSRSSVLHARLTTTLDSSTTERGSSVEAVVTEPVFSDGHEVIFPEGTILRGEVTLAARARKLHRNGQLRFLFEQVQPPASQATPLLASLQSVHASADDRVAIDEEGGATLTNSKTRFIAPTLAILALRANVDQHDHLDPDGDGHVVHGNSPGALGVGGFIGGGIIGIPLSLAWRPVGVALSAVGAARTIYANVLGKGREVRFPAHTLVQLQLAPGPSKP